MLNRLATYCGCWEKPSRCSPFAKRSQDAPNCAWTSAAPSPFASHTKGLWRVENGAIGKRRSDLELLSAMKRQRQIHPCLAAHPFTRLKMKMSSCLRPFTSLSRLKTMSSRKFAAWFNSYAVSPELLYCLSSSNEINSWIKLQSKMKFPTENPRKPGNWNPPPGRHISFPKRISIGIHAVVLFMPHFRQKL